jgi:tol-pal system beta propeller repeat protein TolB
MHTTGKLLTTFDKFLLAGLGCGTFILCILVAWFYYIMQNLTVPRQTQPTADSVASVTLTPVSLLFGIPTQTLSPTAFPTLDESIQLTTIPYPVPTFRDGTSPTGRIVFTCYVKQIDQICLMNADGTRRRQLTDFQATAYYPSLSPDGQIIYFSSRQSGNHEIYSVDINGKNVQRLTRDIGSLYAPELSPDGGRIVFANHGSGIWVMKPDGKNPHPITNKDDIDPTWSPDGSMIAFASSRAGDRQLFVMNANGSDIRQVTDLKNMGGRSTWSPDGTKLAFYCGPFGDRNIYIINLDGTGLVRLTNGGDNLGPSWSPDGNWIAFTSFRDGNNEIYIIRPDGRGLTRLTENSISDWQPRWGR